jgi:hypothetical protein
MKMMLKILNFFNAVIIPLDSAGPKIFPDYHWKPLAQTGLGIKPLSQAGRRNGIFGQR